MKFTAVLGNYNGEAYLEEAARSVLEQDFDDFEFLAVDDGSTDRSVEILRRLKAEFPKKMRLIVCPKNKGQCQAFNVGVKAAKGEFVSFQDSDDVWFPEKLATIAKDLSKNPDVVLHQHQLRILERSKLTDKPYRPYMLCGDLGAYCKRTSSPAYFTPTAGLTVHRDTALKCLPVPAAFRTCADGFLTRTIICEGRVFAQERSLGAYRVHENNNTFQSNQFSEVKYLAKILIPQLNAYYERKGIGIKLRMPPLSQRLFRFYAPQALQQAVDNFRARLK